MNIMEGQVLELSLVPFTQGPREGFTIRLSKQPPESGLTFLRATIAADQLGKLLLGQPVSLHVQEVWPKQPKVETYEPSLRMKRKLRLIELRRSRKVGQKK